VPFDCFSGIFAGMMSHGCAFAHRLRDQLSVAGLQHLRVFGSRWRSTRDDPGRLIVFQKCPTATAHHAAKKSAAAGDQSAQPKFFVCRIMQPNHFIPGNSVYGRPSNAQHLAV